MNQENSLESPNYPSVVGQEQPSLNLAATDGYPPDPASGKYTTSMPVPPPMIPRTMPQLSTDDPIGDMHNLGLDPTLERYHLNLAGEMPIMSPASLAKPAVMDPNMVNAPTFGSPDFAVPTLQSDYDLVDGIDWKPPYGVDPALPDLKDYIQPMGAAMIVAASSDPLAIDPIAPDLADYDRPNGLALPGPLDCDPALPDLKYPTTRPEVMMQDRPGDLADDALDVMHQLPTYKQIPASSYEELYMAQAGDNRARERHQGMLMYGLDSREK